MKSVPKLIRRFVGILLLSSILLITLNIVLLVVFTMSQMPNSTPGKTAEQVADALLLTDDGHYTLTDEMASELESSGIWGILIDNDTRQVVWQTDNLPETIPLSYTLSDIAGLTRGYIDGYPTFPGEATSGLVVLGYPRDSFWKHMWASWDYQLIANLPKTALIVLAINVTAIFLIYIIIMINLKKSNMNVLQKVRQVVISLRIL